MIGRTKELPLPEKHVEMLYDNSLVVQSSSSVVSLVRKIVIPSGIIQIKIQILYKKGLNNNNLIEIQSLYLAVVYYSRNPTEATPDP